MIDLRAAAALLILPLAACAGRGGTQDVPQPIGDQLQSTRQVALTARMRLTVEDLEVASDRVAGVVSETGGFIESSRTSPDDRVDFQLRVPAQSLDSVLEDFRALGDVKDESVTTTDVTDQVIDLEARLQNLVAVRDRLRGYLDSTDTVEEVIAVERELTRVQSEIDSLSGLLERLRNDVAMSHLSLTLHRKRTLGPLGAIGYGIAWAFQKLVIWS